MPVFRLRAIPRALRLSAVLLAALAALLGGVPAASAAPAPTAAVAAAADEATSPGKVTLPHRTVVNADGSVDVIADPKAVAALRARAALAGPCGNVCDGKDPNSFRWEGATCSDADTIHTHTEGFATAELRYSWRCGTAWTRTCCYVRGGGFSYHSGGGYRTWVYNGQGVYSGSKTWTAMLNDYVGLQYEACFDRVLAGAGHEWACTPRF